ncbi:MAG: hypothetical protein ACREMP_04030 [Candidatus Tyrphobacter sp.]
MMSLSRSALAGLGLGAAFAAASLLFNPAGAGAQQPDQPLPPDPSYAVHQARIVGTVRSFNGAYTMYVRDRHGNLDRVELHQGTIITPTGLTLRAGMQVTVYGHADGPVFVADDIETPYRYVPYPYPNWEGAPWGWGFRWGWGWRCC